MSEKAIRLVQSFGLSKAEIDTIADRVVSVLEEGDEDPLLILGNLKAMETLVKTIKTKGKEYFTSAIDEYPENSFTKHGVEFTKTKKTTYDYSNNPAWVETKKSLKSIEDKSRHLHTKLVDEDTGEEFIPPASKTTHTVAITLKKD